MIYGYDVFRTLQDGSPIWLGTVSNLADATKYIPILSLGSTDEYFSRDAGTGQIAHILGVPIPQ
jgi:hypothetical protein